MSFLAGQVSDIYRLVYQLSYLQVASMPAPVCQVPGMSFISSVVLAPDHV
jgi:hypothetical protein